MPRNPSGTYTLPIAAFVAGGVIRASDHNSNYADIATALTQSLATTGVSSMTGPIKAAPGSVSAPSITFASGPTTGFYLSGTNQIGWAAAGVLSATFNADGTVDFVNPITIDGSVPISLDPGTAMIFAQTAAPTFWTKSVTHNDKALRVVSGTASSGGTKAFSTVFSASITNLAAHTHTGTVDSGGAHTHTYVTYSTLVGGSAGAGVWFNTGTGTTSSDGAHTHTFTSASSGTGATTAFDVSYVDVIIATKD